MVTGVDEIVTIVVQCSAYEALQSRPNTELKQEFERHLVALYKDIVRYQISATSYYKQNTMSELFYRMFGISPTQADKTRRAIRTRLA